MFHNTPETIINSNEGALKLVNAAGTGYDDAVRFAAVSADGKKVTDAAEDGVPTSDAIIVDGVVAVKSCDVKRAWKTAYLAPEKAKAEITLPDSVAAGDRILLRVNLAERGRSSSIMQNARLHKNRPFTFEVVAPAAVTGASPVSAAAGAAKKLVALINKEMKETDFKFFTAAVDTTTATKVVLEAEDCYLRFADKRGVIVPLGGAIDMLYTIDVDDNNVESVNPVEGATAIVVVGSEGAGTVAQLIKDLRIPTSASTDPFHGDHGGMPMPGGKYDQYLIEVETERRNISAGIVGALGVSLTSYLFFVEQGVSAAFETMLATAVEVKEAGMPATSLGARNTAGRPSSGDAAASEVAIDGTSKEATFKKKA